jgi:hypothetical protein
MMAEAQRFQSEWERLRLIIEQLPPHSQPFVYDTENYEVLYYTQNGPTQIRRNSLFSISPPFTRSASHRMAEN